jgi:hypothetical protein
MGLVRLKFNEQINVAVVGCIPPGGGQFGAVVEGSGVHCLIIGGPGSSQSQILIEHVSGISWLPIGVSA